MKSGDFPSSTLGTTRAVLLILLVLPGLLAAFDRLIVKDGAK